ncbi:hypothetical protein LEMA_P020060.1 [Plenodomus lingam JN3]|uniref:Myb-like domain-containing protein n=1 Tax=Leptosphaeria maculans (strain JN3 / isolate v23.1.3 / race Av1-4-5-6-7-8) TaxID=985895 RepID=E5AB35_LEPMJ|nr:hypothetical protein LEMA_P020060.1 [Plenodomus lingam JN3]CBY00876.1 hypothetical protein LEMA_P020060.1 [Plenodomus lingam JN3]
MAAEDTVGAAATPPPPVPDKGQAPKPAATFSSFINKNTTGKKFAPKAARRRPGAAPPAPSVPEPAPSASGPATSTTEPAPSAPEPQLQPEPAPKPPSEARPKPEASAQNVQPHPSRPEPVPASDPDASNTPTTQTSTLTQLPTPAATQEPAPPSAPTPTPTPIPTSIPVHTTREKTQEPAVTHGPHIPASPPVPQPELNALQPLEEARAKAVGTPFTAPGTVAEAAETPVAPDNVEPPSRKRRRLPWIAVNHPRDDETDEVVAAPPKKTRTKATVTTPTDTDADAEGLEQQHSDDEGSLPPRKRLSAKARGKRKAAVAPTEGDDQDQTAPKRVRKPRKAKSAVVQGTEAEGDAAQPADEVQATAPRRKPRQPKAQKRNTTEAEGGEGETETQPKRKGRPPREPTPSDAEDETIDPEETYMGVLASRDIRVGKVSRREKEMRKVDWAAVKERRRKEDSRPMVSKQEQEAADRALAEASAALQSEQPSGPRIREVEGQIYLVPDSGTINREADADREIAEYEIIEDQDITARITLRSFLKNNKRFPNDFILPGQGRRWNVESTDLFYQGLKSFGTDFQMISQMFPGSTRRSIKTKFTREERENPERVRAALHGQSEIVSHWDVFLEASQRRDDSFVDADEIKRQLAADEAIMRKKIEAAKAETEERNRQKAAAGLLDDEGGEAGEKENGKKKKRDKGKQVAFQEEQGVEIMGTIDDDDTWGRE